MVVASVDHSRSGGRSLIGVREVNPEDCFTPLKEKAVEVPDYIEWLINEDPEWQEHFSFDAFPIPLSSLTLNPLSKN